jgi:F0F1-type ATP synthase gamma subunit
MVSKKQIRIETDGLISLKNLIEVYEEVAAARMQKVRGAVLQSRQFLEGLLSVFAKIKIAYDEESGGGGSTRIKNNRTVAVFVSANSRLYGDIVDRTFEKFADYVKANHPDVVILGKLGLSMMEDKLPQVLYNYYDFSDDRVDLESFGLIMRYLLQFERILVFYGQFRTILLQEPVATSVSGDALTVEKEVYVGASGRRVAKKYIFEPSVMEIAHKFEGEILASLFEQTLHESQLAKYASRMLALDKSIDNIEKRLGVVKQESVKLRHKTMNRKQLSTVSGVSLWKHAY